jgi:hypothetical protein
MIVKKSSKYKIKVRVELVECDETENHEVNKNNDESEFRN